MNVPGPTLAITPYGDVDANQLEVLRTSFHTTNLLTLVDQLDQCYQRLMPVGGIRGDVLRLHGMAHTILNGAPLTQPSGNVDLVEEAENVANEFRELAEIFLQAAELLQPLTRLKHDHKD